MENKGFFKVILYKETGMGHRDKNKDCEDNVHKSISSDGVAAVALSDGAGSYENAGRGSEITSVVSAELLAERFNLLYDLDDETAAEYILHEVFLSIKTEAEKQAAGILSFSATLLCAALHPDGRYMVFHVGDGAIVGLRDNSSCEVVSIYEHEGPVNQTTFVTVPDTSFFIRKGRGDYSSFVLMSDGPEEFLVNETGVNTRVRLMQQLSFFLSDNDMEGQIASLVNLLNENGMTDDASFAVLSDRRKMSAVIAGLSPELRKLLFSLKTDLSEKRIKKTMIILDLISNSARGVTIRQVQRELYIHSKRITKEKINDMLDMKLIRWENGRLFIAD